VIGFLSGRSPEDSIDLVEGLRRGPSQEGYVEGKNVAIEYRWAEGHFDRLRLWWPTYLNVTLL
jgi:putative tryptophan/tyrosine transport system substrate-binding protein